MHIRQRIETLGQDEAVFLNINGQKTEWRRMKLSAGKPTRGIRVDSGAAVWKQIPMGQVFTMSLFSGPQSPLFQAYLFADYSGAEDLGAQRSAIRIAYAEAENSAQLVPGKFDRKSLVQYILSKLTSATKRGIRVCLGQDHMYGFPTGLAQEVGIRQLGWRSAVASFLNGNYHPDAPSFDSPKNFARRLNEWLANRGHSPYFWSATKADLYSLPGTDPRREDSGNAAARLTDVCCHESGRGRPKLFNRLGDRGSVGGQSLFGMRSLGELMHSSEEYGIKLRVWPFDGVNIADSEYASAHVLVEPYPSALRHSNVPQTDADDALYTVKAIQAHDLRGQLQQLLDLSTLSTREVQIVRFEGWIAGNRSDQRFRRTRR